MRPVLVVVFLTTLATLGLRTAPAHAALFTFDDVPHALGFPLPDPDAPQSTDYRCGGKDHCTQGDIATLTDGGNQWRDTLSVTRDGITATFSRQGRAWDVWPPGAADRSITSGNDPADFDLFLADFDAQLAYFEAAIRAPAIVGDEVEAWVVMELWSEPGAAGLLVASRTITLADWTADPAERFALAAPDGQSFVSARFGWVRSDDPDCRVGCLKDVFAVNRTNVDDVLVSPIPEPEAALVFGVGVWLVSRARRPGAWSGSAA